uniref:Uncharacterized protein n=1 Tax=Anopheles culicifacies TaxID=139723 RepID=A0A182LVH9_9DIPT
MLRFLSRRKGRNAAADTVDSQIKSQRIPTNKNLIPCRVILLDNTDLSVDLTSVAKKQNATSSYALDWVDAFYHQVECQGVRLGGWVRLALIGIMPRQKHTLPVARQ